MANTNMMILITILSLMAMYTSIMPIFGLKKENIDLNIQKNTIIAQEKIAQQNYKLLENDKYLAQQARGQYHLSEEGEIIFTFPTPQNKDENEK